MNFKRLSHTSNCNFTLTATNCAIKKIILLLRDAFRMFTMTCEFLFTVANSMLNGTHNAKEAKEDWMMNGDLKHFINARERRL